MNKPNSLGPKSAAAKKASPAALRTNKTRDDVPWPDEPEATAKVISINRGTDSPASKGEKEKRAPSVAQQLVSVALREYRLGCTTDGKTFAVPHQMGNVARPISSKGVGSLMEELSYALYENGYDRKGTGKGSVPSSAARGDAQAVLNGKARSSEPEEWFMRVGRGPGDSIVIDMGDADEHAIIVTPKGWKVVERSPILFRRTAATGAFPMPARAKSSSIDEFRQLINMSDEHWDLFVSWLVVTFVVGIPHALLAFLGQQGTAKTDTSRMAVMLVDPGGAPVRAMPTNARDWLVTVQGSWVTCLENVSSISSWLSDLMCMAITGAGDVARGLFTDEELRLIKVQRVLMINGIEVGQMQPDLADRTIRIELQRISEEDRMTEGEVTALFDDMRPRLFSALLDLLASTLAAVERGEQHLEKRPRMADYAEWIHAVDYVRGTNSLDTFVETNRTMAIGIAEEDPVTVALRIVLHDKRGEVWTTTFTEWLGAINDVTTVDMRGSKWPRSARALSARINRIEAGLETGGWRIDRTQTADGVKFLMIDMPVGDSDEPAAPAEVEEQSHLRLPSRKRTTGSRK